VMGAPESHREEAPRRQLLYVVVTVSTSRYQQSIGEREQGKKNKREKKKKKKQRPWVKDESGDVAQAIINECGHGRVVDRRLLPDDERLIMTTVSRALGRADIDVIVLTGGTGVSTTDVTIEAVRPLFEKEIEGFGELFRAVSYSRIGVAAALSRAAAGIAKGKIVICLPGSPDGVKTALDLFIGEIPHVLHLIAGGSRGRRGRGGSGNDDSHPPHHHDRLHRPPTAR
jgi:molybdenum cofactor biosynthesis protein B